MLEPKRRDENHIERAHYIDCLFPGDSGEKRAGDAGLVYAFGAQRNGDFRGTQTQALVLVLDFKIRKLIIKFLHSVKAM